MFHRLQNPYPACISPFGIRTGAKEIRYIPADIYRIFFRIASPDYAAFAAALASSSFTKPALAKSLKQIRPAAMRHAPRI